MRTFVQSHVGVRSMEVRGAHDPSLRDEKPPRHVTPG